MSKARIENLADAVFAITLTLLVLELKIPESTTDLIEGLHEILPALFAHLLVFVTLTTYWFTHHYLVTIFAKKIDRHLANANILFLFFLSLLPFSANLLGRHLVDPVAVIVYWVNVLAIIASLNLMRYIIRMHPETEMTNITALDMRYGVIRVVFPVGFALIGIALAFTFPHISLLLYIIPLIFGIIPGAIAWLDKVLIQYIWKR